MLKTILRGLLIGLIFYALLTLILYIIIGIGGGLWLLIAKL